MSIFLALLVLGLVFIIVILLKSRQGDQSNQSLASELRPYVSKTPLTPTETIFYHRLVASLPDFIVLAQVQLSSFLKVDTSQTNNQTYNKWFNPIAQQSIDYLICKKDFTIVAAVELDDKSHLGTKAIKQDNKKTNNLDAAKVTLIRWHAEAMPQPEEIKQVFLTLTQNSHSEISDHNEWLADTQQSYFSRPKNQPASLPKTLAFGAVLIGIIIWGSTARLGNFSKVVSPITQNVQNLNAQVLQKLPVNAYQELLDRQQRDRNAQDEVARQKHTAQQLLNQQQEQQRALQVSEDALKEEVWNRDYKKGVECSNSENMVTCGNKFIQARQRFEQYWESKHKF
jgi:hypothetical protein